MPITLLAVAYAYNKLLAVAYAYNKLLAVAYAYKYNLTGGSCAYTLTGDSLCVYYTEQYLIKTVNFVDLHVEQLQY